MKKRFLTLFLESTHRMTSQYHPIIGHIYIPNLTARIPNENGGYYVRTNAHGFRSDIEFEKKRGNIPRVLFLGDSNTAGDGVNNHERFSDLIGQELFAEAYNFGLSGTGTDQQLLIYENCARDIEANLLILCISVHNIDRIRVRYIESIERTTGKYILVPKPYFELNHGGLTAKHVPVPTNRPTGDAVEKDHYLGAFTRSSKNFRPILIDAIKSSQVYGKLLKPLLSKLSLGLEEKIIRISKFDPHPDYKTADSPGWRLMQAILNRFCLGAAPTPVLIVPLPTWNYLSGKIKPQYQNLFNSFASQDKNIFVMDITRPLMELPLEARRSLFLKYDPHFSPYGHRQIAVLMANTIITQGILSCRAKDGIGYEN